MAARRSGAVFPGQTTGAWAAPKGVSVSSPGNHRLVWAGGGSVSHMFDVARMTPRSRRVLAALAVVWLAGWTLLVGAHDVGAHAESVAARQAHAVLDSAHSGFTVTVGHPHLGIGSPIPHPEQLMTAVVPRSATALDALTLVSVIAGAAVAGWLILRGVPAGRGPPAGRLAVLAGQDRLIRFCLSRR